MPIISEIRDYDGVKEKILRLGLARLYNEVEAALRFDLIVLEERHANGTKGIREAIDELFEALGGWVQLKVGGIDWTKANEKGATIGVEVQVSGRSDMLAVDIMHLKDDLVSGRIDVGVIVVPDNILSKYLTDRTPNLKTAVKHVGHRASDLPIRIVAFKHDGVGPPLAKARTNLGKALNGRDDG